MTPAARLAAAIEVLTEIEERHRPVAAALKDWGTAHRFAGSGDRAAIGNIVYDALRWRGSNAWAMESEAPRALVLATVGRRWGLGADGIAAMFAGDPHAPGPPSAAEAARIDRADLAAAPPHVRADVPEWLEPRLAATFGDGWVAEGEALALRPPLDMRANRLKADRDKVAKALTRFSAADTPLSPDGLRIAATEGAGRHPNVQVEPAFRKGWFEIQDEGSQIAALMVAARPGDQVLDLCAGAGGKSLALAAMMENKGQVFATDSDRSRLAPIFERLKRAGTRNVQVRPAGASLDDLIGRMDAVLVDAPCTGSGTWRRRPDAKWRLTERALANRVGEQTALLAAASAFVKPGGRLVYVTCSVLPEENDGRISAFLAAQEGKMAPMAPAETIAAAPFEPAAREVLSGPAAGRLGLMLSPRRTGTDAFFIAVMRKE